MKEAQLSPKKCLKQELIYNIRFFLIDIGSMFGSFETAVLERSVSRDTYKQKNQLPEWMSCDPEKREFVQTLPARKLPASSSSIASSFASLTARRDLPSTGIKTTPQPKP